MDRKKTRLPPLGGAMATVESASALLRTLYGVQGKAPLGGAGIPYTGGAGGTNTKPAPPRDPITTFQDADLILELVARGYAVWKPPVGE